MYETLREYATRKLRGAPEEVVLEERCLEYYRSFFFLLLRRPRSSPLFPYTTLFRSPVDRARRPSQAQQADRAVRRQRHLDRRPAVAFGFDRPGEAVRSLRLGRVARR